jgi:hypothetical protein
MLIVEAVSDDQNQIPAVWSGFSMNGESGAQHNEKAKKLVHLAGHRLRERAENNPA